MIDFVRLLNNACGIDRPIGPLSFRDLATEVQIVEVQKGELRRLRRLLGEGLYHGASITH